VNTNGYILQAPTNLNKRYFKLQSLDGLMNRIYDPAVNCHYINT